MKRAMLLVVMSAAAVAAQSFQDLSNVSGAANLGLYSTGLTWGDYDGDGALDLYVTNWSTNQATPPTNALYHNDGDETFTDLAAEAGVDDKRNSSAAAFADYDNDGDLDLYVADFYEQDLLYQNQGDGSFIEIGRAGGEIDLESRGRATSVAWGDYNGDGHLDLYLGKYYFENDFYENRGDGTFLQITDIGVGDKRDTDGVTWADYDNDGDLDLYIVNREQENTLYRNRLEESGSFEEVACVLSVANGEIGQGAAWADYDNDGDLDLYLANVGANALYRNDGEAAFQDVAQEAGVRIDTGGWITAMISWADFDGDGWLDLYLANGGDRIPQADVLYAANGDLTFRNASAEANLPTIPTNHSAASFADFDGNNSPDIYATDGTSWGPGSQLFQNETPGNRFVKVLVRGKGGAEGGANRDGIGARIRLTDVDDQTIAFRQANTPNGVIFGVAEGQAYLVEVLFPGNDSAVIVADVSGGDKITVVEP